VVIRQLGAATTHHRKKNPCILFTRSVAYATYSKTTQSLTFMLQSLESKNFKTLPKLAEKGEK